MRNQFVLLFFFVMVHIFGGISYADIESNLEAYYRFSGNADDATGNGHHGTVVGVMVTQDRLGQPRHAYAFDGVDDHINVPNHPAFVIFGDSFTLAAWILNTNTVGSPWKRIVTKRDPAGGQFYSLGLLDNRLTLEVVGDVESWTVTAGPAIQGDGIWHHVAAVQHPTGPALLYVDGVRYYDGINRDYEDISNGAPVEIGKWGTEAYDGEIFRGKIDEVRIYSSHLHDNDVLELFHYTGPLCPVRLFHALPYWYEDIDVRDIVKLLVPARVEKTFQTTSHAPGDDGALQRGVAWPFPRFTDNADGTVTDNLTGLIWLKGAAYNDPSGTMGTANWIGALVFCGTLNSGECGLTDGSIQGDWRLPNVRELQSLLDYNYVVPALSNSDGSAQWTPDDPFSDVQPLPYWTSTDNDVDNIQYWSVNLADGSATNETPTSIPGYVWPVRGEEPEYPGESRFSSRNLTQVLTPAPVEKTQLQRCHAFFNTEDACLKKGVSWPNPRFTDNQNGTIADNLTGLIWLKDAHYNDVSGEIGPEIWVDALGFCNALESGYCGLTDGSAPGDWRLPNVKEMLSLIGFAFLNPALPNTDGTIQWTEGDPFDHVDDGEYWTSTTTAALASQAFRVALEQGNVTTGEKTTYNFVWPVRGGD